MDHFMAPKSQVLENDNAFMINVQLPGLDKGDVKVDVKDNELTILAETKESKEEKNDTYHLREFKSGKFKRNFYLPKTADVEAIKAEMKNGVLEIEVPKKEKAIAKEISIK
jgi:HSP20 family protein